MRFKIPSRQPTSFKASALYLAGRSHGHKPDRVAWMESRNLETDDPGKAAIRMDATAAASTRCKQPQYHFIISFDPNDAKAGKVNDQVMREIAGKTIERMGLAEHLVRPEKRYLGRRRSRKWFSVSPSSLWLRLTARWRSFTDCQRSSSRMQSSGTSCVIHSDSGFIRAWRLPVSGSLRQRWRFQISFPTYISLLRMPLPRFGLPLMVLEPQSPPPGAAMPSLFSSKAIRLADLPAA